jgi:putative oxidoreductase
VRTAERFATPAYTLFRMVTGMLFACHGAQKILGLFGGTRMTAPRMLVAGSIELVGGTLIVVGLFGALAAFVASGEMAFAYFTAHAPHGFWPIVNHGELAVLYCFAFLFIAASGSGRWSLDARLRKRSSRV